MNIELNNMRNTWMIRMNIHKKQGGIHKGLVRNEEEKNIYAINYEKVLTLQWGRGKVGSIQEEHNRFLPKREQIIGLNSLIHEKRRIVMKKFTAMLLTLALALSLTACGGKEEPAPEETKDPAATEEKAPGWWKEELTTINEGKLTVVTSPDFAPFEFYALDENGEPQLAGFDMALAQYVADYLELELEVLPMEFKGTILELGNGKADLGMAGYSPDPKRASQMDFSNPYVQGGQAFVTVKANAELLPDMETANNPDFQIGAQTGSIQMDLAKKHTPDADIVEMAKVTDLVAQLLSGKMDGAFIEKMVAECYQVNYPELEIVCDVPNDSPGSVVGVSKGNEALLAGVNEALAQATSDGTFDQFVQEAKQAASAEFKLD